MIVAAPTPSWLGLFNRPGFLALRDLAPTAYVVDGAALTGVRDGDRLVSGASAPFGGIELAKERDAPERVQAHVAALVEALRADGVRHVTLRQPVAAHAPAAAEHLQFALLNHGFHVADADLAAVIDLRHVADGDAYVAGLRSPARRALKHAGGAPFTVAHAETSAAWDAGWALLEANREDRGRRLSLDRAYVERLRTAFPDHARLLELRHDGLLVAASFSLRIRPHVEFVAAWGDAGHGLERSPMNRLAFEVVARALREGVSVVDLGTGTDPGRAFPARAVNPGLCRFKASVGAVPQVRYVLEAEL